MQNLMMSFRDKLDLRGLGWLILEGALDRKDPSLVTFEVVGKKFMMEGWLFKWIWWEGA